jgi:hypothetical protein
MARARVDGGVLDDQGVIQSRMIRDPGEHTKDDLTDHHRNERMPRDDRGKAEGQTDRREQQRACSPAPTGKQRQRAEGQHPHRVHAGRPECRLGNGHAEPLKHRRQQRRNQKHQRVARQHRPAAGAEQRPIPLQLAGHET